MAHLIYKNYKNKFLILFTILGLSLGYTLTSNAQHHDSQIPNSGVPSLIYKIIMKNGLSAGSVNRGFTRISFSDTSAMKSFYGDRGHTPLWVSDDGDTGRAADVLEILEASWVHGLNPENYHTAQIRKLLNNPVYTDKARLELFVSDAVMRYGRDLSGMRIDPNTIKQKAEFWREPMTGLDVAKAVSGSENPVQALANIAPNTALYKALQKELISLSQEKSNYDHVLPMSFGGDNHFTPGQKHKDVTALRLRLGVEHKAAHGSPHYYDDHISSAVMKFQRNHNLEPDGIIGPQSLAVLNRTKKNRMEQIVANLERLRWLEQERPDRYILVNIPQQLLWAVENGKVIEEQKVVVGMPWRRTKDFKTEVTGVRFNPTWTVPQSIKMSDFLPKLKKDPSYLTEKKIEVIKGYGRDAITLDPMAIDWHSVGWKKMGKMRFVQTPGDHNALGRVRILMQNGYNIYMHDTNHPEFFERGQRTYSSGCVRLEKPKKVASFVLRRNQDWSDSEMDALTVGHKTVEVDADTPFPAYIIYQSIWLDGKGSLVFGPDVYKRDKELIEVLSGMDGYKLPTMSDAHYASVDESGAMLAYNK